MSNSNGTQTLVKSMNGILSFDTGGGVVISGDTIVADTIDLQNLNIDNIQGIAPADNITLYTNTTGNINLGGTTTALTTVSGTNIASTATNDITNTATRDNTVKATRYAKLIGENQVFINTNSLSTGTITIDAGSTTNINNGTGKPVNIASLKLNAGTIFANGITDITVSPGTSGALKIAGGQQIEANNNANGFTICNNLTAGTFYLGNSTVGPSTTYTAVNPYELVNYQTAQSIASGSSLLGLPNIWTNTNEFQDAVSIGVGAASSSTFSVSNNSGLPNIINLGGLQTINNIKGINININASSNGNISIGTGTTIGSITIGNPSITALNIGEPMTPTYVYSSTTGTNLLGTIGYIFNGTYVGGTTAMTSGAARDYAQITVTDDGVYMIQYSAAFIATTAGVITRWSTFVQIFNAAGTLQGQTAVNTSFGPVTTLLQNQAGSSVYTFASVGSGWFARLKAELTWSSGAYRSDGGNFAFTITRIA